MYFDYEFMDILVPILDLPLYTLILRVPARGAHFSELPLQKNLGPNLFIQSTWLPEDGWMGGGGVLMSRVDYKKW